MTHNTREIETILEVLPHLILGNAEALHKYPQGQLAKDTISEMQRVIRETHHQELQKAREQRKGWKGYVVVDPKADNYKYSPIYMDRREATLWLAENGDDGLEVAEVDILLAHHSELDQTNK